MGAPVRATQDTDDRPVSPRQHAFGAFELDRKSGELRKHGLKVKLADQPLQVLLLLLEHPGDVVGRDDIRRRLWSSDTFVDFDAGLSSAVRKLRDALGDSAEHPRFIETLPKRGYRFIAPVSATADASAEPVASPAPSSARPRKYYWMPVAWVLAVAAGIVLILALAGGPWRIRPAPPLSIQSIAVLPFAIVGDDPAQQYFADGMTEGITGHLAQAGGFLVISRTSAMHYKHTTKQRPAIGRELQVDAIVEGSVTRSGDQVRISARVMPVSGDRQIWAGEHDGNLRDVVALQDRVAQAIVETIGGRAAPARHSPTERTVTPKAYDAYLKGVSTAARGSTTGFHNAVVYFEEAIAGQPDFAMAHAALAQVQLQLLFTGPYPPREVMPKAEASARRAIALDDALPAAHRVLGQILHNYHWRWEEGDREIGRALELNGNSVDALSLRAFALIRNGRFEEAIADAEGARRRDPLSFTASMNLGSALRAGGQYDRAIAEYRRGLTLDPYGQRAHFQLGVTFGFMRRWPYAITELETAHRMAPNNASHHAYLGYAYAMGGRQEEARKILDDLAARAKKRYVSAFSIALLHDALGEKEPAMAALQRAYDEQAIEFSQLRQYGAFQSIRDDPRYAALMRGFRPD